MSDFDRARNIQATIRHYLGARSGDLTPVPEIQVGGAEEAIHKLQVQVFALSDAITALVAELDSVKRRLR